MGARGLIPLVVLTACPAATPPPAPPAPAQNLADKVVADFEKAVLTSKDAYVDLFDFVAVGEYEILLHRYDLLGRLSPGFAREAEFKGEDGTPYPPTREKRNVGNFYPIFVQRTVGTGGCVASPPRTRYGAPARHALRSAARRAHHPATTSSAPIRTAGSTRAAPSRSCKGGQGSLVVVYTQGANARGFDLITIYDD